MQLALLALRTGVTGLKEILWSNPVKRGIEMWCGIFIAPTNDRSLGQTCV